MHRNSSLLTQSESFFTNKYIKVDFAILSAMPEELEFYTRYFASCASEIIPVNNLKFTVYEWRGKRILCGCTGLGTAFAAAAVTLIHSHFNPTHILFSGTAGAIRCGLKCRDVIVAESAFEAEMHGIFEQLKDTPFEGCLTHPLKKERFPETYAADNDLFDAVRQLVNPAHYGTVVSSNMFPAPPELFEKIKSKNPLSIDMETSALYQTAWLLGIKALAIRGISNVLNIDGTDDNVHESDVSGSAEAAAKMTVEILDHLVPEQRMLPSECQDDKPQDIHPDAEAIIGQLELKEHPEGGYYTRTFQSSDTVKSTDISRYKNKSRPAGTAIYYLLNGKDFSAWHQLKSDEIWHFYKGCPTAIHIIDHDGTLRTLILGDLSDMPNASFQVIVPAGRWFAAEPLDKSSYCLVGCTVAPGFDFNDFKLADRNLLTDQYPQHADIIRRFTRLSCNASFGADSESEKIRTV